MAYLERVAVLRIPKDVIDTPSMEKKGIEDAGEEKIANTFIPVCARTALK